LPSGTIVDQYYIERTIAKGGFSNVYLARQINDQHQVAIKEYMPAKFTHRVGDKVSAINGDSAKLFKKGRQYFLDEAKLLTTIKHPNIVHVLNFFLANDTAYLVMSYDYGMTLAKTIKEPNLNVTSEFLLDVFPPIMRCIKNMHNRNLLHLDIKPDNILLRPQNNPLILDFGSALPFKKELPSVAHSMTKGFAAPEQHHKQTTVGPWSDIYAIGATMRACLDKSIPPMSTDGDAIVSLKPAFKIHKKNIEHRILHAIDWAMQIDPGKRPQSMEDLMRALHYL
jgi:serine/threonine protein kinase